MRRPELSVPLIVFFVSASVLAVMSGIDVAQAQNSLGIGGSEQAVRPTGWFAGTFFWIQQQQKAFYQTLTEALKQMRAGNGGVLLLVGVSFAYGIFHAAGPGHGKAVISSYMLANEVAAKRGIILSFASAFLQAIVAIALIAALTLFLRGMGLRSGNVASFLEITSYVLITLLGAWLLYTKIFGRGCSHAHHHDHDGHHHAPNPARLQGDLPLRDAVGAILAVGIRPCTGAIVVLTFAFLNGLYVAGILSTFAMALGTGITVSALALLAVSAKSLAERMSKSGSASANVHSTIEIAGAGLVFLLGLTLLGAALST